MTARTLREARAYAAQQGADAINALLRRATAVDPEVSDLASERVALVLARTAIEALDQHQEDMAIHLASAIDRGRIDEEWIAKACELIGRDPSEAQR